MSDNAEANITTSSQWKDVWDQFKTHRGALIGMIVFFIIVIGVIAGPFIWTIEKGTFLHKCSHYILTIFS